MAEESKFAGTLKRLKKPTQGDEAPQTMQTSISSSQTPQRLAGKRSDPQWTNVTILMRKSVKRAARRKLEDEEAGRDLSTLVDALLTDWLAKNG